MSKVGVLVGILCYMTCLPLFALLPILMLTIDSPEEYYASGWARGGGLDVFLGLAALGVFVSFLGWFLCARVKEGDPDYRLARRALWLNAMYPLVLVVVGGLLLLGYNLWACKYVYGFCFGG